MKKIRLRKMANMVIYSRQISSKGWVCYSLESQREWL